ncbi:MAG: sigma-70 family RNA polymerase sigma factor [Acidimicrobiales bacterium]
MEDPLAHLAAAAAEGNNSALEALVLETRQAVTRVCVQLGSPGETDDLVQETYLRMVRALPGFRAEAPILAWLLTIARRTCADQVRRRERSRRIDARVRAEPIDHVTPPPEYTDDLLDAIDPDRRDAFVLTQIAGLSYADAAAQLRCPVGTIRSRVARARDDLRALVEPQDAEAS